MNITEKVGKRIQTIRLYSDVKQKALAEDLDVNAPLLSMYEKGKREPSLSFIERFCNRFEMSLSQFFTFDDIDRAHQKLPDNMSLEKIKSLFSLLEEHQLSNIK